MKECNFKVTGLVIHNFTCSESKASIEPAMVAHTLAAQGDEILKLRASSTQQASSVPDGVQGNHVSK